MLYKVLLSDGTQFFSENPRRDLRNLPPTTMLLCTIPQDAAAVRKQDQANFEQAYAQGEI